MDQCIGKVQAAEVVEEIGGWDTAFFFLIIIYCAIRKNPMLHINKYFFNQGGAL